MILQRRPVGTVLLLLALAGCREPTLETPAGTPVSGPQRIEAACPSPEAIKSQLEDLFVKGQQTAARSRFDNIEKMVTAGKTTEAVAKMFVLVDWTLEQYGNDKLAGGQSEDTQEALTEVVASLYCFVGLEEPDLSPAALGPDGAVAVIYPSTPDTVIKTETGWAEVVIPAGALPTDQPVLVTLARIPETPFPTYAGPLSTELSQFPLFYEYATSPAVTFEVPVTIGICLLGVIDLGIEPGSRLRVAHNVGSGLEILPWAAPPPMDCGDLETASTAGSGPNLLARPSDWAGVLKFGLARAAGWMLPPPLAAAPLVVRGTCCLGGTTRTFSPFGGVDPVSFLTAVSPTTQGGVQGTPVASPPKVRITTDPAQGAQPVAGVGVRFEVIAGGGTVNGATFVDVVTDANGDAAVTEWVIGAGLNQVTAVPSYVALSSFRPASLVFEAATMVLSVGDAHACAIRGGNTWCWGRNDRGQIGTGATGGSVSSPAVVSGGHNFVMVSTGLAGTCAVDDQGAAWCWGYNLFGAIGDGTTTDRSSPTAVNTLLRFTSISIGFFQSCGLDTTGQLWCWGTVPGLPGMQLSPVAIAAPLGVTVKEASVGAGHICTVSTTGAAHCWGEFNDSGILGIGSTTPTTTPTLVTGGLAFATLHNDAANTILGHNCGVTTAGTVWCWGEDREGELGIAVAPDTCIFQAIPFGCALNPQQVSTGYTFKSVEPGNRFTCGLTSDGHAACWGWNVAGALGDGTNTSRYQPAYALVPGTATAVGAGGGYACAAAGANEIYCWGSNSTGRLGTGGTPSSSTLPLQVLWGIVSVTVAPSGATVPVSQTLQMAATVTLDPTAVGTPTVLWSSSDASKATVSSTGLVTGVSTGTVAIRATAILGSSTAAGTATVTVVP